METLLEIKVKIYRDAVRLFEEGKIYPAVLRMLKFRYEEYDGELVETFVEKARNKEWEDIKNQADRLEKRGLDVDAIRAELQHLEPDAEVFNYVIDDWRDIKELHRESLEQNTKERKAHYLNLIYSVFAVVVIGIFAHFAYTKDMPLAWRIIVFSALGLKLISLGLAIARWVKKHNEEKRGI